MVAVHDVFIHLGTTVHVSDLTVSISCRVYAAPYASSATLPSPRNADHRTVPYHPAALSNQAVRTGGTRVHLVVDQVFSFSMYM